MGKLLQRKYLPLISIILLFANCGYKFLSVKEKAVFIMPVKNSTLQPGFDTLMDRAMRQVFTEEPHFLLSGRQEESDIALKIDVKNAERRPLFYSRRDSSEIVSGGFYIEADVQVFKSGEQVLMETLSEHLSFSLAVSYREEEAMGYLAKKFAAKIYFWMVEKNEKGFF